MTVPVCRNRILPLSLKAEANDAYLPSAHPAPGDTVVLSEGIAETAASFRSGGMRSTAGICRLCSQVPGTGIRRFSAKTPCGRTLRQNGEDCRSPGFQESAFLQRFRRKEPAGTFRLVDPALSQSLFELQKFVNAERFLVLVPLCPPVG